MRDELPLQRAARLHEQGQVDRLVRHAHSLVAGVRRLQPAGDLLRRPVLLELRRDQVAQDPVAGELARLRPPRPLPGTPIGLGSAVATAAAVSVELARDRRGRAAETGRDPSRRLARRDAARDLLPLLQRQHEPTPPPLAGRHAAVLTDRAVNRAGRSIERPANLTDRLASLPPLPELPTLPRRVLPPLPRHRNTSSSTTEPMLR